MTLLSLEPWEWRIVRSKPLSLADSHNGPYVGVATTVTRLKPADLVPSTPS